ncbi:MAG: DNA polymerase III subunit gamma/tau [Deltaproteobacteria bacterium]|nr:DNA polymerase III subunit gamma/tau [Deltaproteobacteria bacterium]
MAYEVLARKWRPQVFQDVIGQEHITQTLMNAIKTDRLAHAYLFSGARGVGKTSVARILAKAINCEKGDPGIPCNACHSCREITSGSSVDVQEIDGASNRGIDEIRELRENIKYMPTSSKFRIYIIDEVHMLTLPAFNALLKTLEEPPPHVKFIFATTEPHKVPVTILSRCQRFDFKRIPLSQIVKHLERIAKEESIEITQSGLALIARESEGSMRDAESLLDQVSSFTGAKVDDGQITDILGIVDRDLIFETSLAIIQGSPAKCLEIIDGIYNYGHDIKEFYRALMDHFRNLLVCLIAPEAHMDMADSDREEIGRQAEVAGIETLQQILNLLIVREADLRFTLHPRLLLETLMVKLCRIGEILSFDQLIQKIESLEKRLTMPSGNPEGNPHPSLSEPSAPWGEEPPPQKRNPGSGKKTWEAFLPRLATKNKGMANVLRQCHMENKGDNTLEITKAGNSFASAYLDEPENIEKLKGFCIDFFGPEIKIKILEGVSQEQEPVKHSDNRPSENFQKNSKEFPRPVQDILEMFQGKIKEETPAGD